MNSTVVGVDVGGPKKGFHAVAFGPERRLEKFHSRNAREIATWCQQHRAMIVAVDAPCRWRREGSAARAAERELAKDGISSFSTPTEAAAQGHAFYTWMLAGMELYQALAPDFPIYDGGPITGRWCIETFPQAAACALAGKIVSAKEKNSVRRGLLAANGIAETELYNLDEVDAAICALTAEAFADGTFDAYGDALGGLIVVPAWRREPATLATSVKPPVEKRRAPSIGLAKIIEALPSLSATDRNALRDRLSALERELASDTTSDLTGKKPPLLSDKTL